MGTSFENGEDRAERSVSLTPAGSPTLKITSTSLKKRFYLGIIRCDPTQLEADPIITVNRRRRKVERVTIRLRNGYDSFAYVNV